MCKHKVGGKHKHNQPNTNPLSPPKPSIFDEDPRKANQPPVDNRTSGVPNGDPRTQLTANGADPRLTGTGRVDNRTNGVANADPRGGLQMLDGKSLQAYLTRVGQVDMGQTLGQRT